MRHAALTDNDYCWSHHELAAREAGLSPAEIKAICTLQPQGLVGDDRLLVELVDAVVAGGVTPELRTEARERFGDERFVRLLMLIGYYSMVGTARLGLGITADS